MKKHIQNYPIFFSLIAGACIGLGFPFGWVWPASCVGIALLIYLAVQAQSLKHAFVYGTVCGFVLHACALGSIALGVFPLDWYGIENQIAQVLLVGVSWLIPSIVLGAFVGVFASFTRLLSTQNWYDLLLLPALWVLSEFFSSLAFYLLYIGPGSLVGPHFTLGYVGYLLAHDTVLLQAAFAGGVYALSFVLICMSALLLLVFSTEGVQKKKYGVSILLLLCAWVSFHAFEIVLQKKMDHSTDGSALSVAAVSRYMPPTLEQDLQFQSDRYNELLDLVTPLQEIDLVIFPENSTFIRHLINQEEPHDIMAIERIAKTGKKLMLIDSQDVDTEADGLNSLAAYFNTSESLSVTTKQFLLPLGEYVPYLYQLFMRVFGGETLLHTVQSVRGYIPGSEVRIGIVNGIAVAVRFCDEVMSPVLYREQVNEGAQVLVNISSLSWFHGSPYVYDQMKRIAKVRAVESGRWFIQSGNMAPAFVLDHRGSVIEETEFYNTGVVQVAIKPRNNTTPYMYLGPWILLCFSVIVLGRLILVKKRLKL